MNTIMRKIIKIDEEKCDGCGICAEACHEGAIRIIDGKAKLVSETYCDGLGDCIGECPQGAISFEMREAAAYDEEAVKRHMAAKAAGKSSADPLPCGCPGSAARDLRAAPSATLQARPEAAPAPLQSELVNWPVQIRLVPETAPWLHKAELVIGADCVPFAFPDFHRTFLAGGDKVCLIGCPKLDDAQSYVEKLTRIISYNETPAITVARMEVPCCGGMTRILEAACEASERNISLKIVTIGIRGDILDKETIRFSRRQP